MTKRRIQSRGHAHRTAHRAALENPETAALLQTVARKWAALATADRSLTVAALLARGCTARGLAHDLGCSEGAVRWLLRLSELPEDAAARLRAGESGKKLLGGCRTVCIPRPNAVERAVSRFSSWLSQQPLPSCYYAQLTDEVQRRVWDAREQKRGRRRGLERIGRGTTRYAPDLIELMSDRILAWLIGSYDSASRLRIASLLQNTVDRVRTGF